MMMMIRMIRVMRRRRTRTGETMSILPRFCRMSIRSSPCLDICNPHLRCSALIPCDVLAPRQDVAADGKPLPVGPISRTDVANLCVAALEVRPPVTCVIVCVDRISARVFVCRTKSSSVRNILLGPLAEPNGEPLCRGVGGANP
jgi:hypothetical protein